MGKWSFETLKKDKYERTGLEKFNKQGSLMKIIEYKNTQNLIVEFQDKYKYKKKTTWEKFQNGGIKNKYFPTVQNVGITGELNEGECKDKPYRLWVGMLDRCYNEQYHKKHNTYIGCSVCDEWLYYPNFKKWIISQKNYSSMKANPNEWNIDKDILIKNNKIYSPDTCCIVPKSINLLLVNNEAKRGEYPVGVCMTKDGIVASINNPYIPQKTIRLGTFKNVADAFKKYKETKEMYIKQVANDAYKNGDIDKRCYEAMMNYVVEIND